jgi:hypothetical protein
MNPVAKGETMKPIWTSGKGVVCLGLAIFLLTACTASQPAKPLFFDAAAWNPDIRTIALVEVSFDRRYQPPPDYDFERDLEIFFRKELERKGYRFLVAVRKTGINTEKSDPEQLAALAPAGADASLAVHVDYLFFSQTLDENPPPETEIAAEARLIGTRPPRELWRDYADATAGGNGDFPVGSLLFLRQNAMRDLAEQLFATLPDAGKGE